MSAVGEVMAGFGFVEAPVVRSSGAAPAARVRVAVAGAPPGGAAALEL